MSTVDAGPGSDRSALDDSTLLRGLEDVRERIRAREAQLNALRQAQQSDQEEEKLLASLYALRTGKAVANGRVSERRRRAAPHPVVEAVVAILQEAARPLHISEIMVALRAKDIEIPGSGQQANVIAHITRDRRIVRPLRGMYALAAWPSEVVPQRRVKRRRVRSSTRTRTGTEG